MTHALPSHSGPRARSLASGPKNRKGRDSIEYVRRNLAILAVAAMLAPLVFAQGSPRVTGVDPSSRQGERQRDGHGRESGKRYRVRSIPLR